MNKIRLIVILFLTVIAFALFVGGTMPYFLLFMLILTFLVPLIHSFISLNCLTGQVDIPRKSFFPGDKIDIGYIVQNKGILSIPYLEIRSNILNQLTKTIPTKLTLSLKKKAKHINKENIVLSRRGYYEVGEVEVTVKDVFDFYSFTKKISSSTSLIVYPDIISLSSFDIISINESGEVLNQNSTFQDKSRISTLREYMEGDSIKDIHWKLSAKKDIPIVKSYDYRGETQVFLFMDNFGDLFRFDVDRRLEDKAVETSLSIIDYCLNQNIKVSLETQNKDKYVEIKGFQYSELQPFLEALARFKGDGFFEFGSVILPKVETLKKGSNVIIITPNLNTTMGSYGISLKMKNINPLFITICDMENKTGFIDQGVKKELNQEGILVYIIDYSTCVKDILEV